MRLSLLLGRLFDEDAPQSNATRVFNFLLVLLIIFNDASVVLETVEPPRIKYAGAFAVAEHSATFIFTVEHILRVWISIDLIGTRDRYPVWGRLRYMRSFAAIVDLLAVLPAILGVLGADDLRVLRLLRLLHMLKLTRHSAR